jgi:hypothetical protein
MGDSMLDEGDAGRAKASRKPITTIARIAFAGLVAIGAYDWYLERGGSSLFAFGGPPACGTTEALDTVRSLILQSAGIETGDVVVGYKRPVGLSELADAEIRPTDKKSADVRASKISVDASVLKAALTFKFDGVRPKFVDREASKTACLADLSVTFNASAAHASLPDSFYVFNAATGSHLVPASEALRAKASSVRWKSPLSYSVQRTESGQLYVTLE